MEYGLDVEQFREHIVVPTLQVLELLSYEAACLVLGTALHESHLKYIDQLNDGPAVGLYQMEKPTYEDIWTNFLSYHPTLAASVKKFAIGEPSFQQMEGNLYLATAMCRVHYFRVKDALPQSPLGMSSYWKIHYNTNLGKGTIQQALPHFERACA